MSKKTVIPVNNFIKKHLKLLIDELIKKDARKEAFEILSNSDKETIGEFLFYYYSSIDNVACMVLDKAKGILVDKKIMKQKKNDAFNGSMFKPKVKLGNVKKKQ